jgi:toxin YoeB
LKRHICFVRPPTHSDSLPHWIEYGKEPENHKQSMSFVARSVLSRRYMKTPRTTMQREAVFQPEFREDLRYWVETDRSTALRIFKLIEAIIRDPFQGIGKPESLKFLGSGVWSRRITQEHRLVYVVGHERIDFVQGRYHY